MDHITKRELLMLLGGGAAALAAGPMLGQGQAQAQTRGGTVVIPLIGGTPSSLNPAVNTGFLTAMPGTQLFASPLRFDANWQPQPYLAESWDLAADGLSLTLKLVAGATFHDGKPITSEDVAFSLMALKANHPFKQLFAPISGVDTPDAATAVIRLSQPQAALLLAMSPALCPILPKHIFDDGNELRTHPANLAPVGSGPFRFVEFTPGQQIILERYDAFFIPDRPVLDRVIYSMINDQTSAVLTLDRGDADLLANLNSPRDAVRLAKNPELVVSDKGYDAKGGLTWLAFNMLKEPLNDKRVRQAICYAADRETILKNILQGQAKAATGPIHPASPFYTDAVEHYAVDLDKANQLLDEAGHARGGDGTRFKLVLDYSPAIGEVIKSTAEFMRQQLRKVGIDVEVRTSPDSATWARRIGDWEFDMTIDSVLNWGDPSIGVARTYASSNIRKGVVWTNTQNYNNPTVDEILDKAAQELDLEKRKALYAEFQKIVVDDAPIYFINVTFFVTSYKRTLAGISDSIWGVTADPMDEMHWSA